MLKISYSNYIQKEVRKMFPYEYVLVEILTGILKTSQG